MTWTILKFGGSSVHSQNLPVIEKQIQHFLETHPPEDKILVVFSAMGKSTNLLLQATQNKDLKALDQLEKNHQLFISRSKIQGKGQEKANFLLSQLREMILEFISHPNPMLQGQIISQGEKLSTSLIHNYLLDRDISNTLVSAVDIIQCDNRLSPTSFYVDGKLSCHTEFLADLTRDERVAITQGFVARDPDGNIGLLSRGGSDTTAALIASAVKAKELQIWTDVNGIYSADPRDIPTSQILPVVDYQFCQELAASGGKVLHPYCIRPCQKLQIPIYIKNTYFPDEPGTKITQCHHSPIALTRQKNITVFQVKSLSMWEQAGFMHDIFKHFKEEEIDVDLVSTSQFSVTTTTASHQKEILKLIQEKLSKKYCVSLLPECQILTLLSPDIIYQSALISEIHQILKEYQNELTMIHYGDNKYSISLVLNAPEKETLLIMDKLYQIINITS